MTKELKVKAPKKKKIASLERKKARAGWIFVLPFVLGFILVYLPMIIDSIRYTFYTIKIIPGSQGGGFKLNPVGWENYVEALFNDPDYIQILLQGLQNMALEVPMILMFSLFMAVLLNQKMAGRAVFRAIFFVPVILSTGLMASIEAQNLLGTYMDNSQGIEDGSGQSTATEIVSAVDFERLFSNMAIGTELLDFVINAINNIYDIVNRSGVQILIFLAGLQSISPAIYESVKVDGATGWETFWKITFPMISPMILVNSVYTIIDSFTAESNVVMKFIAKKYTESNVVSSAMAWVYFLVIIAIIAIVAAVLSTFVFYQRKD